MIKSKKKKGGGGYIIIKVNLLKVYFTLIFRHEPRFTCEMGNTCKDGYYASTLTGSIVCAGEIYVHHTLL